CRMAPGAGRHPPIAGVSGLPGPGQQESPRTGEVRRLAGTPITAKRTIPSVARSLRLVYLRAGSCLIGAASNQGAQIADSIQRPTSRIPRPGRHAANLASVGALLVVLIPSPP